MRSAAVPGLPPAWRRFVRRHRRPLAVVLVALAVLLLTRAVRPGPAATTPVLVAAANAPAGAVLSPDDVSVAAWPVDLAPPTALTDPAQLPDRPLTAPISAGEPLVPTRFLSPSVLAAYGAGLVATPVRLADAGVAALLRAGDLVDVLAAAPSSAGQVGAQDARTVATAVRVLITPQVAADALSAGEGSLVVLATTPRTAATVAGAAVTSRLSVVLRAG